MDAVSTGYAGLGIWRSGRHRWRWQIVILLTSVGAGILTGLLISKCRGQTWRPPIFNSLWLVCLGFLPQFLSFYLPATRQLVPDKLASLSLVSSQILLMGFAWKNRNLPGIPLLLVGLGCNLAVILLNGGFMPLAVETAAKFIDQNVLDSLVIGARIGKASKDILLPESQILLSWLADRYVSMRLLSTQAIFSIGDVFVALGTFWVLLNWRPNATLSSSGESL